MGLEVSRRLRVSIISITRLRVSPGLGWTGKLSHGDTQGAAHHLLGSEDKEVDGVHQAWCVVPELRHHDELPQQVPGRQHGGDPEPEPGQGTQGAPGVQPRLLSDSV